MDIFNVPPQLKFEVLRNLKIFLFFSWTRNSIYVTKS